MRTKKVDGVEREVKPHDGPTSWHERVRTRAYEIFERRNGGEGDAQSDWSRAENELRDETGESDEARGGALLRNAD